MTASTPNASSPLAPGSIVTVNTLSSWLTALLFRRPEISAAECWDPGASGEGEGAWHAIADLPTHALCCACAAEGQIYVFLWGRRVARYDPGTDTYRVLSKLPLPEWFGFACTAWGSDVYLIGGQTTGTWTGRAFRYETGSDTWHEIPGVKQVRRRLAAVTVCHVE
mmetsp:Transcript_25269/g.79881  ORF Transcript_25269/g.79881 Transcript_25269/m.79881 type:complete len:166 (-) Transcript_25269:109-606(-)